MRRGALKLVLCRLISLPLILELCHLISLPLNLELCHVISLPLKLELSSVDWCLKMTQPDGIVTAGGEVEG